MAGPAAHFDRNESHVIYGIGHRIRVMLGIVGPSGAPKKISRLVLTRRNPGRLCPEKSWIRD